MRTKWVPAMILVLLLLPFSSKAQVEIYAVAGGGATFEKGGETDFSLVVGGNIPLFTDTTSGFTVFERTIYHYVEREGPSNVQALSPWVFGQKKWLGHHIRPFVNIGTGYLIAIEDGADDKGLATAIEFGVDIKGTFSIALSVAHQPIADPEKGDRTALMLLVDLYP